MNIRNQLSKGLASLVLAGALSYGQAADHIVKKGETMSSIARQYNLPLKELSSINPGINVDKIQIGQKLNLPSDKDSKNEPLPNTYSSQNTNNYHSLNIRQDKTSNFNPGRANSIEGIVIHSTEGSGRGALDWHKRKESKASAHYYIMEDGEIVQLVKDEDTAWHTGAKGNKKYLGIEFAGYAHKKGSSFTEKQYISGGSLVAYLLDKHNLADTNIVSHDWVSKNIGGTTHSDPGPNFDWKKFNSYLSLAKGNLKDK